VGTGYAAAVGAVPVMVDLPQPGDTFAGKYTIVRLIGEGGMGCVFEANHVRLRQRVAIKLLLPSLFDQPDVVLRFEREGRTAAKLRGQNVARILDVDTTREGLPYIVMEYLEGRDLDVELQERGALPIAEAVGYVLQACNAMVEAHDAGIVHRDLKPANLFVSPGQSERVVKVLDFGISKNTGETDARLTGTHATVGTPLYMSPEQIRSSKSADARTDIWALGVILFELLTGRPPFIGSTTSAAASICIDPAPRMRDLRVDVPAELEAAVQRTLEKDPARRFPDVRSFAQAIAPFGPTEAERIWAARGSLDSSSGEGGLPLGAPRGSGPDLELARAATISSRDVTEPGTGPVNAGPLTVVSRGKPPPTSPGWVTQSSAGPRRRARTLTLVALVPVLAIAALGLWTLRTPSVASPPAASSGASVSVAASGSGAGVPVAVSGSSSPTDGGAPVETPSVAAPVTSPTGKSPEPPSASTPVAPASTASHRPAGRPAVAPSRKDPPAHPTPPPAASNPAFL
jgi:eukaryotic-like serine/threonine-protein kinase